MSDATVALGDLASEDERFRGRLPAPALPSFLFLASTGLFALWLAHTGPGRLTQPGLIYPSGPYGALRAPSLDEGPAPCAFAVRAFPTGTLAGIFFAARAWEDPLSADSPPAWRRSAASNPFGELVTAPAALWVAELELRPGFTLQASLEPAPPTEAAQFLDNAPLPPRRPTELAAAPAREVPAKAASPDNRSFFEKIFGSPQPARTVVAYASPERGAAGNASAINALRTATTSPLEGPSARYDRFTAVYDISAHAVYLPNGAKLEAHSGLGEFMDDPRHVSEHAKGATPPDLYELTPREKSFYGVQALRMTPIGEGNVFGRSGLLAHPYMLGPNGDSFGCVSFKDYQAFLQAYQSGQVKRIAVVARLD